MSELNEQDVREAVVGAIRAITHDTCGALDDSDLLHETVGLDSLQAVELAASVERALSMTFPPGSERHLADALTIGELVVCMTKILREDTDRA